MSLFRQEALAYYARQDFEGDVLRFDTRWLRWTYRLVAAGLVAAVVYLVAFDVNEYATGVAFVEMEGRRALTTLYAGTVDTVHVQPGQHVVAGQLLVTLIAENEEAELHRASAEFNLHLAQLLREPGDATAKASLASLRPRRDQALAIARARFIRAPAAGVVTDVRARPGLRLDGKAVVLGIAPEGAAATLVCVVGGDYRPMLKPGQDIRFALDGYKFEYRSVPVESVGEEVIGPLEMKRFLGPEIADAFPVTGPSVLVKGRLPSRTFVADGLTYGYVEGLTGKVDIRVRTEPMIVVLLPALKALRGNRP